MLIGDNFPEFGTSAKLAHEHKPRIPDSEIVMVEGTIWDDSFDQDRSWEDSGTTISGV